MEKKEVIQAPEDVTLYGEGWEFTVRKHAKDTLIFWEKCESAPSSTNFQRYRDIFKTMEGVQEQVWGKILL